MNEMNERYNMIKFCPKCADFDKIHTLYISPIYIIIYEEKTIMLLQEKQHSSIIPTHDDGGPALEYRIRYSDK